MPVGTRDAARDSVMRLLFSRERMLKAYSYSLTGDWALAEDIYQEVAVYVVNHWRDFTAGTNFGAWVRSITRNRWREAVRKRHADREIPTDARTIAGLAVREMVSDEAWDEKGLFTPEHKRALADCLDSLPAQQREVLRVRYEEGRSCSEVAASLGLRLETVYVRLSRLRARLLACVDGKMLRA